MKKLYSKMKIYLMLKKNIQLKTILLNLKMIQQEKHVKLIQMKNYTIKLNQRGKNQILNTMPTTEKVISQVQCQACDKSMSAKNVKSSHAAYCIKKSSRS